MNFPMEFSENRRSSTQFSIFVIGGIYQGVHCGRFVLKLYDTLAKRLSHYLLEHCFETLFPYQVSVVVRRELQRQLSYHLNVLCEIWFVRFFA